MNIDVQVHTDSSTPTAVLTDSNGATAELTAATIPELRRDVIARLIDLARQQHTPYTVTISEPGEQPARLTITPNGNVTEEPAPAPTPAPLFPDLPEDKPAQRPAPAPIPPMPTGTTAQTPPAAPRFTPQPIGHAPTPAPAAAPQPQAAGDPMRRRPTREDLIASQPLEKPAPAQQGFQGFIRRASFGLITPQPGQDELTYRAEVRSVQRSLAGPKTIVVLNPKGGAHKTTATLMIGATFGIHRGGSVLAWDNNETQGTLGARSARLADEHRANTAVDLLQDLDRFNRIDSARFGDLDNFVRGQGEAKFDVLASDDDPRSDSIIDATAFNDLHTTLSRFYRVMVIDTGNNMKAPNWQAAVARADQLVIVSTLRDDTAAVGAALADRLYYLGHGDKLANGVTILSEPSAKTDKALNDRLDNHFRQITRAVVHVPYEPDFVGGGRFDIDRLKPATRRAWLHACAQIAEGLN